VTPKISLMEVGDTEGKIRNRPAESAPLSEGISYMNIFFARMVYSYITLRPRLECSGVFVAVVWEC
jgi:hypothetical protein